MSASFRRCFRALDLTVSVASDVPTVAATLDMLTSCYELVPRAEDYAYTIDQTSSYTARVNDVVLYESASEHEVVSAIELDIYDRVMRAAQGRWLVHAAGFPHVFYGQRVGRGQEHDGAGARRERGELCHR